MLLSIVVYVYTVIAFNFFRKFYVKDEDGEVDYKCHDMLTVYMPFYLSFHMTFKPQCIFYTVNLPVIKTRHWYVHVCSSAMFSICMLEWEQVEA